MLIALYSSTPQQGKFAETLKLMMRPVLEDLGRGPDGIGRMLDGDKREMVYQDRTLRHALQTLGTEWGRKCMGENFWVDIWRFKAERYLRSGVNVVVDDMRFPNEFAAVQALDGWTWKVVRPGASAPTNGHASEGALDGLLFDTELVNAGTLHDLEDTVEAALRAGGR
jgi:hypothetical protein